MSPDLDLDLRPVAGALGAEVRGLDVRDLDDDAFAAVEAALVEHEVLFFRDSKLDEASHIALAERFGTISAFPVARLFGSEDRGIQVIEDGPDSPNEADYWHTDVTWMDEPPKIGLLRCTVPARGGDTMWGSMTAAYEALSPTMKELLEPLVVRHDNTSFIEATLRKIPPELAEQSQIAQKLRDAYPGSDHPLIRVHPVSGRRSILYAGHFMRWIVGMEPAESRAILDFLGQHVDQPRFHCRWQWQPNDLAIWDERSTIHQVVNDFHPQRRVIARCVVDGDRPRGVEAA